MIRIGIIGTGRMGNAHANNIANIEDAEISVIYDINPEKITAFLEKHPGAKVANSPEELASSPEVDLIAITSPTYCHAEGIRAAMKTGKPIFCEKPLCRTRAELDELAPLLRSYNNLFAVGFVRRYSPGFITFKKLLEEGKIGNVIASAVTCLFGGFCREWGDWFTDYKKSGGVILDMLAHHCDLQNGLFGKPETVYAKALLLNTDVEKPRDYVSSTLTYKNNIVSNMECSWFRGGPNETSMIVYGEKGSLKLTDTGISFYDIGGAETKIEIDDGVLGPLQKAISGGMYAAEMAAIIDCIKTGKKPFAGVEEAIAAMEVALAMMESAETGAVSKL